MWCSVWCVVGGGWCVVGGVWCVGYGVWGVLGVGGVVLGTMSHCGSPCAWRPRGGPRTQPCSAQHPLRAPEPCCPTAGEPFVEVSMRREREVARVSDTNYDVTYPGKGISYLIHRTTPHHATPHHTSLHHCVRVCAVCGMWCVLCVVVCGGVWCE